MRQTLFIAGILLIITLPACKNKTQNNAIEQAKQDQSAIQENKPGTVATTADGYTMRAKINGKEWAASSMMPPATAGRIVGYLNAEYIGLPYDKGSLAMGNKNIFGEANAVDLSIDDAGSLGGEKVRCK